MDYYKNNKEKLLSDINLIFENAKTFNQPETLYYKYADDLIDYISPFVEEYYKK